MGERRAKIAVSVDAKVLRSAERIRKKTGETRSALVNRALLELTRHNDETQKIAEYVEAYRRFPESSEDIEGARSVARRAWAELPPWDDE